MSLFVVRHAKAGDRSRWRGPDVLRPLSDAGHRQAQGLVLRLVAELGDRPLHQILSSGALRCRQTVEPLARKLGLPVDDAPWLAEGADPAAALALLRRLAGSNVVVCSHGDVIPEMLDAVADEDGLVLPAGYEVKKGSTWVLEEGGGRFMSARYLPPPD